VSSTVADLTEERRAVLDWLRLARHLAVDSYVPNSDTVRVGCLEDVGRCDLYVLILGHRYGFQPTEDNLEGLSITHLEFQRAGECGIPRVALLRTSIPDVSLSDVGDPQRLALVSAFRDEVGRQVRPAQFNDLLGLIQGLSTGIHGELDKLDKRAKQDERHADPVAAAQVLRLAPRPVFLAGREELLAALKALLARGGGAGPRMVALCGLGGTGKTSLALDYAHGRLGEVGVAWQLPAGDPAVLAAGFAELAVQLGAADRGDPVAAVHGVLAVSPAKWLLLFDNAPDRASVARYVPPAGPGLVLITSRNQIWPPGVALQVPVLDPQVAADFLVSRTGDADRRAALELADVLGGLPLALEQAAAYVQASTDSLAGYASLFRQRRADLLDRGEPIGSSQTVATTWRLAFEDVRQAAPGAAGLLRLLAFCAPEAIPLRLLLRSRPGLVEELGQEVAPVLAPLLEDPLAAGDAIAALRRYSLITPAADGSVSVHRLVQAVTADQMPAEPIREWQQAAASLIEAAIPRDPTLPAAWPVCAALLPHALTARKLTSDGMRQLAEYLGASGSYSAARDLYAELLPVCERIVGPEHPDTLTTRHDLARWTGLAGDAAAARDLFAALLPVRERVLGPVHPTTLATRHELAYWTGLAGDAAAARDLFAALLPVRERISGPEGRETLTTRHNLANWTGKAGDAAAARDLLAELLPACERILGPEHPDTLTTRANLAHWIGKAGDAAAARDLFAALLPVRERVLGPVHPATLAVRANLAAWIGKAGDAAAARDHYAALLPLYERVLGPEHPDTLTAHASLASWTGEAGDAVAARDHFAALLPLYERVLGPEHPDTLATRRQFADWNEKGEV